MRTRTGWILAAGLLAAAGAAPAEPAASPSSHARTLVGTVAAVAADGKSFTVRDERGKQTAVALTTATRVTGGTLGPGRRVTVRWMLRDKKNVATAVRVHAPEAERTAAAVPGSTPSRPPNPTPGRP